jgi:hypothetical protein
MTLRLLATPLVGAALLLSTLGCSKKSDPEPSLEGTWDDISSVSTAYVNGQPQTPQTTLHPGRNDPNGSYRKITGTTIESYYNNGAALGSTEYYTRSGNTLSISIIPIGSSPPVVIEQAEITQLTATDLTFQTKSPASQSNGYDYFIIESHCKRH